MTIAVDFDGTIIEEIKMPVNKQLFLPFNKYKIKDNCIETLNKYKENNIKVIINSSRYGWYRLLMYIFIKKYKLPIICKLRRYKPIADIYIDDKNLGCKEINWYEIERITLCMK